MITKLTFLDIAIAGQSLLNSLLEHDEDDTHFSIREVWFFRGEHAISG